LALPAIFSGGVEYQFVAVVSGHLPVCSRSCQLFPFYPAKMEFADIAEIPMDEPDTESAPLKSVSKERARELQMKREATRRKKAEQMGALCDITYLPPVAATHRSFGAYSIPRNR
jgi:hypothetical protein